MKPLSKLFYAVSIVVFLSGCNYITYTPRSKKQIQREKPSIVLLNRIVEFREEYNSWPFSKEEFVYKAKKFRDAFEGFPYMQVKFKVIDNDRMTFSFYDHIKDAKNFNESGKVDLNSYGGEVRFYKEKDKFIWKLKMK